MTFSFKFFLINLDITKNNNWYNSTCIKLHDKYTLCNGDQVCIFMIRPETKIASNRYGSVKYFLLTLLMYIIIILKVISNKLNSMSFYTISNIGEKGYNFSYIF